MKSISWDRKIDRTEKISRDESMLESQKNRHGDSLSPLSAKLSSFGDWAMSRETYAMNWSSLN
jgi:hypothetical protein